jgi:PAS domain S-box-containing protein
MFERFRQRVSTPRAGAWAGVLVAALILLPIWWGASQWYQARLLNEYRANVAVDVALRGDALSSAFNRRLARLQGLHAFIQTLLETDGIARLPEVWEVFAESLFTGSKGIRNLAVAPDSVVRYIYPLVGNEAAMGYEPLRDPRPEIRDDTQRAIVSGEIVVTGPLDLVQGGTGLVARQAVQGRDGYWGLVNVVMDLPVLLVESEIIDSGDELDLALRDAAGRIFFGSGAVFEADPVVKRIELPDGVWELAGLARGGWQSAVQGPLRVFQGAGLIIAGLLTGLVYLSVNRQSRLAQAVRQRTEELRVDIARRTRVEAALREREQQYRGIFESSRDGLFINDMDGRLVDFNPEAARMHGYTPEQFRKLQPEAFIHPGSLHVFERYIQTVRQGKAFRGRAVDLRKDGTPFPVEVLGTGFSYRGKPHTLAVVRDVTEEVQAYQLLEQRVQERTQELSILLEVSRNIVSTLELKPLLSLILDRIKAVVDYTRAGLLIIERDGELALLDQRSATPGTDGGERTDWTRHPLAQAVIHGREPIILPDVPVDAALAEALDVNLESGRVDDPTPAISRLGVPLLSKEQVVGLLILEYDQADYYTDRHAQLTLALANQVAVAVENARLYEQARRLAVLEERQRLARELHDSVSQALYGIGLGARTARELLEREPARAAAALDYILSLADSGLAEMRALIFELRPDSLEKEGLVAALSKQFGALRARYNIEVNLSFSSEPALPFEAKEALYRVAQEAVNNTVKHARAQQVTVSLSAEDGVVVLEVLDDGLGFEPRAKYPGHFGLLSMRERIARMGGTLEIESEPGSGTCVRARIPVARVA